MHRFFRVAAFLLLIGAALHDIGRLAYEVDRLLSLLALGVFFASFLGRFEDLRRPSRAAASLGLLLLAVAAPAAVWAPLGMIYFHLLVLAAAVVLTSRGPGDLRAELASYLLALSAVVLAAELNRVLPLVWHLKQAIAGVFSSAAEPLARENRNLGPTAMGLPLLFALVSLAVARAVQGLAQPRLWVTLPSLVLAHIAYLVLLTPTARYVANQQPTLTALLLNSQYLMLLVGAAVLAFLIWICEGPSDDVHVAPAPHGGDAGFEVSGTLRNPRLVIGFVLGVLVVVLVGRVNAPPARSVDVLLHDAGFGTWNVPVHGSYGERSGGMFGVLPELLSAAGFNVQRSGDLSRLDGPDAPDCVVLINIQRIFEAEEKKRLLDFVHAGGGLLCLGDHTGVAGIRGPFNDLVGPLGIRFRFDTATFLGDGWADALEVRNHPMNRGVRNDEDFQIWAGASLELDTNAVPTLVAKYGFSDWGDTAEIARAFLGDRRYNPYELLGDLVLAAEVNYGKGKVLVFGDTSGFQNLSLPRSYAHVLRSLRNLGIPGRQTLSVRFQIAFLLLLALGLGAITSSGRRPWPLTAVVAGTLVASLATAIAARPPSEPLPRWQNVWAGGGTTLPTFTHNIAVIDRSHGPRFDMRAWTDKSIGGLLLNVMRNGFFPMFSESFPRRELEFAELLIIIAPARGYSSAERQLVRRFLERGGRVFVCVGHEEFDGARSLLGDYGFSVRDVPLAHFRTGDNENDLVFHEAWALVCPAEARVLVRQWNHAVVATRAVGEGEIVVVGDSYFLSNSNLESLKDHFIGNIRFLDAVTTGQTIEPIEGKFDVPEPTPVLDSPEFAPPVVPAAAEIERSG